MKKIKLAVLACLVLSSTVFSQIKQETPGRKTESVNNNSGVINLISPANNKSFASSEGGNPILFRWTALLPKPKEPVTYRVRVWQLMQGQNAGEAMRSNQPVISKDVANITQTAINNLYTGPCKPPYLCDFVWTVTAINSNGGSSGTSDPFGFKIIFKETGLPDTLAKAVDNHDWETICTISCERQGVLFVVGENTTHNEWRLSCTFREKVYYLNSWFNVEPNMISYVQIPTLSDDPRVFCNNLGSAIDNHHGVWEITEINLKTHSGIITLPSAPPCDFHALSFLWNNSHPIDQTEAGCRECEAGETGDWGEVEPPEPEIEIVSEPEPPEWFGSGFSSPPVVVYDGSTIRLKIRDRKQADKLKNMGMVLSDKMPANSVKCVCGKNVWAKNNEAGLKICDYLKALFLEAKGSKETRPIAHVFALHAEKIMYDSDSNVVAMTLKTKNGGVRNLAVSDSGHNPPGVPWVVPPGFTERTLSSGASLELPVEKIVYDADKNVEAMTLRTKKGGLNILKVVVAGSNQLSYDNDNAPRKDCWKVYCNNPNHPLYCGWWECK
jgi:hypothetical protein